MISDKINDGKCNEGGKKRKKNLGETLAFGEKEEIRTNLQVFHGFKKHMKTL